ncbi:MAG TPA: LLM class flavin-dependent oxidoreductase [Acidimicrobiales bacterium]|jgi:probable F420-dependent oxidoreductase|nr:LLM class flavin-dependent oxidoreductase [Acidimicrobiales bacterium]
MKVRIGVGMGTPSTPDQQGFAQLVDDIDELGFDSIWLPEVLTAPTVEPLTALAYAAAHNPDIKLGTTMVLPGRNPVRLAKELATLDMLSEGRLLTTFVPGIPRHPEAGAVGVPGPDKGRLMDEVLPLLRRLWTGEIVSHHGEAAEFDDVCVSPTPVQQPLEFWTGGMVPAALRRCGRFADGWLPSLCTPDEAAEGAAMIHEVADEEGRAISPEHFGVSIGYSHHPITPKMAQAMAAQRRGVDPAAVVPVGIDGLRDLMESYLDVGFSKFVVRPMEAPHSWRAELELLADGVLDMQS